MHFEVVAKTAAEFSDWVGQTRATGDELTPERYIELSKQSVVQEPFTFKTVADGLFDKILDQTLPPGPGPIAETNPGAARADEEIEMFGKLTWGAIPFDQPIPLFAGAFVIFVVLGVLAFITIKGWIPYLWREWITSVDHKRIGVMYVSARCGDAAAWLYRCGHDAIAAGARVPVPGLPAAGAL